MEDVITVQFDGGSRGNPGPAGIGVVLSASDGTPLVTLGRYIGRATNNAAEYTALITGLQEAKRLGAKRVAVRGDSELIVRQMRGEYKVRNADLRPLYEQAKSLLGEFEQATIQHNYRHHNALADRLANIAMDRKGEVRDVDEARGGGGTAAANVSAAASPLDQPSPVAPKAGERFACVRCGCVVRLEKPSSIRPHQLKPFGCQCGAKMVAAGGESGGR
jgi:ribonuclease HI